jgi:hypothetical protein
MREIVRVLKVDKFSDKSDRISYYWRILCNLR